VFLTVERTHVTLLCAHFPAMCAAKTVKESIDALLVAMQISPEVNAKKTISSCYVNIMQEKITT